MLHHPFMGRKCIEVKKKWNQKTPNPQLHNIWKSMVKEKVSSALATASSQWNQKNPNMFPK